MIRVTITHLMIHVLAAHRIISNYSKTCLQKEDQKLVLKTDNRLIKVKSIAECSLGAFCNTFNLH